MASEGQPTEVYIFGRTYQLRGDRKPDELRRLGRIVDGRMREIAPDPARADGLKVAVLAAINFADEVERCRQGLEERGEQMDQVSARLSAVLADCLDDAEVREDTEGPRLDAPR